MENRNPGITPRVSGEGSAEVHSSVTVTPETLPPPDHTLPPAGETSGSESTADKAKAKAQDAAGQAKAKAQDAASQAKERAGEVGQKASEAADQARARAGEALETAQQKLEETGAMDMVRDNALAAMGVAFGIGFLLAGSGDDDRTGRGGRFSKTKRQLKHTLMGSLSTVVAQQLKSTLGDFGIGGSGDSEGEEDRDASRQSSRSGGRDRSPIITDTTPSAMRGSRPV